LPQLGVPQAAINALQFGAYVNAQSNTAKGLEMSGDVVAGHVRLAAAYTYVDAVVTASLSSGVLFPSVNDAFPGIAIGQYSPLVGNRPFRRPANSGSLVVGYEHSRFDLSLAGYFFGKADDSPFLPDPF
jgi:iron complex outermembrane receptor protein/vitamin B12 transporter